MAHNSKWTRAQCPQVLCHDYHLSGRKTKNKEIDPSRRHLNYNLAPHNMWAYDYLQKRLSEVYCLNRKDVNVLSTWLFTVPRDVLPGDEHKCLKAAYKFLEDRYGKENVVSAWTHFDEDLKNGRPHIHFNFIPVIWDDKKNRYKVSAKEVINRKELTVFHDELEEYLYRELGYHCSVLTGEMSDRPELSIDQFKSFKENAKNKDTIARLMAYEECFGFAMDMTNDTQAKFLKAYKKAYEKLEKPFEKIRYAEISDWMI